MDKESTYQCEKITKGKVPSDLYGTYLYNTPNPYLPDSDTKRSHWFAGDGMVHAITLGPGKDGKGSINYCNRYSKTNKFLVE